MKDAKKDQVVQFLDPKTGRTFTGTVVVPTWGHWKQALIRLESGAYVWAWVHELSEKENDEHTS